ncbi:Pleckstrin homology domain-containing family A member 3 [Tupaia chinensis]|nr:Pleckstrin homology domain-containing family A member 3 [Tupaia chinensis]
MWLPPGNGGNGGPGSLWASASASAQFSPAFQSTPRTSRVETPTPMCVDPPDSPSKSLPPFPGPGASHTAGLSVYAPGLSSSPFVTSPASWAAGPVMDSNVTPMDTTPPPRTPPPLTQIRGFPKGFSGLCASSAQAPQTPSKGIACCGMGKRTPHTQKSFPPTQTRVLLGTPGAIPKPILGARKRQWCGVSSSPSAAKCRKLEAPAKTGPLNSSPGQRGLGRTLRHALRSQVRTGRSSRIHGKTRASSTAASAVRSSGSSTMSHLAGSPIKPRDASNKQLDTCQDNPPVGSKRPAPLMVVNSEKKGSATHNTFITTLEDVKMVKAKFKPELFQMPNPDPLVSSVSPSLVQMMKHYVSCPGLCRSESNRRSMKEPVSTLHSPSDTTEPAQMQTLTVIFLLMISVDFFTVQFLR